MVKIVAKIGPVGAATVSAYSLKNDTWEDFEFFLTQAADPSLSARSRNRALRAAHFNLYSHFEAVVYELGKVALSRREKEQPLQKRCKSISKKAKIQPLELVGRSIRNEITHPGKDESKPFLGLNADSLKAWSIEIGSWLDKACANLGVRRFTDTELLVSGWAGKLGEHDKPVEI